MSNKGCKSTSERSNHWVVDTGAIVHSTLQKELLTRCYPADNTTVVVMGNISQEKLIIGNMNGTARIVAIIL